MSSRSWTASVGIPQFLARMRLRTLVTACSAAEGSANTALTNSSSVVLWRLCAKAARRSPICFQGLTTPPERKERSLAWRIERDLTRDPYTHCRVIQGGLFGSLAGGQAFPMAQTTPSMEICVG